MSLVQRYEFRLRMVQAMKDDAVVANFIHRVHAGEMDTQSNVELGKLTYSQILTLSAP